jgi:hypothetical protein
MASIAKSHGNKIARISTPANFTAKERLDDGLPPLQALARAF